LNIRIIHRVMFVPAKTRKSVEDGVCLLFLIFL
jgi:hypothetical protein